ncbi:MAG: T9SS type A sorting domain-containing protein [Marinilabiliaceae bacterium]|nr:T9SS type A sorting domain-containing protein [Marinilabiliaceae bacterium]
MRLTLISLLFFLIGNLSGQTINYCVDFDGNPGSRISLGELSELNACSEFTIECWVRVDHWNDGGYILQKEGADWQERISVRLGSESTHSLYWHLSDESNYYLEARDMFLDNQWHHIRLEYEGEAPMGKQMRLYYDGNLQFNYYGLTNYPQATASQLGSLFIGNQFDGRIDELRIWNTGNNGMSPTQYMGNTIHLKGEYFDRLIGYWRFDYSGQTNVIDYTNHYNSSAKGFFKRLSVGPTQYGDNSNARFTYKKVTAYLRNNVLQMGNVSDKRLRNINDCIYFAASPTAEGGVYWGYPDNSGILTNSTFLSEFNGRPGVLSFDGNSKMNCGKQLLWGGGKNGTNHFTLETFVYVDQWVQGSSIVESVNDNNHLFKIEMGEEATHRLYIKMYDGNNTYMACEQALELNQWHHFVLKYDGSQPYFKQCKVYVDGVEISNTWYSNTNGEMPSELNRNDADLIFGNGFKGKLDEIRYWDTLIGIETLTNAFKGKRMTESDGWYYSLLKSYWPIDDQTTASKDVKSWKVDLDKIRSVTADLEGYNIRVGSVGGSFWKEVMGNSTVRDNYAHSLAQFVLDNNLQGVDMDCEWPGNLWEWKWLSLFMDKLKQALPDKFVSVSLQSYFHGIDPDVLNKLDGVTMQSYDRHDSKGHATYEGMITDWDRLISKPIPSEKIIMGVPFYTVNSDKTQAGYSNVVGAYPNVDPDLDEVIFYRDNGSVTASFNGQTTMARKMKYLVDNNSGGTMFWSLGLDVDTDKSLLRIVNRFMSANTQPVLYGLKSSNDSYEKPFLSSNSSSLYYSSKEELLKVKVPDEKQLYTMSVFDIQGRKVLTKNLKDKMEYDVDLSGLSRGMFVIKIKGLVESTSTKIVKN